MNRMIGLSVGSTLQKGKFVALILKFQLDGGQQVLTAWNEPRCTDLFRASLEYIEYLRAKNIDYDGESIEKTFKQNEPLLTADDVEAPPVTSVVKSLKGHVNKNHELLFSVELHPSEIINITIGPKYIEWIIGYMGNTMNEFDVLGNLPMPPDVVN